jgi:hypothetical protein
VIKYETFIIKTFDQVKKHNFDQVNFGQTTPCQEFNQGFNIKINISTQKFFA